VRALVSNDGWQMILRHRLAVPKTAAREIALALGVPPSMRSPIGER